MSRKGRYVSLFMLFVLCVIAAADGQASPSRSIDVRDIENGLQIVGRLGLPLGALVSIEGRIVQSGMKGPDRLIEIDKINGRDVQSPFEMKFTVWEWGDLSNRELLVGEALQIRAYETGGMVGIPRDAMKETVFVQTEDWRFETSLVLVKADKH